MQQQKKLVLKKSYLKRFNALFVAALVEIIF